MSLIRGENVVIFLFDGDQWKPVICGKSCSITTVAETIETSITGSGNWRTYEYAGFTWSANIEGATNLDQDNTITLNDFRLKQRDREKIQIKYQRTDQDSNVYTDQGYALITNVSDSGAIDDLNLYTIELQGSGPLTLGTTPTPINPNAKVKRFEYTAPGGSDGFSDSTLLNRDVIEVVADGIGRCRIITSGSPVGQEVLYDVSAGSLTFPMILEQDVEVYVLYQDL